MTRRGLSPDERELWAKVRRSVRPIRGGREAEAVEPEALPDYRDGSTEAGSPPPAATGGLSRPPPPQPTRPRLAPLAPLEPRARRRLARGAAEPEARLDLHGMRQQSAFHALAAFLRQAQARGARTVLVITGKGRGAEEDGGVLRRAVPRWLAEPRFRPLVVGYETAAQRHGGDGAFYVRLRRHRRSGA